MRKLAAASVAFCISLVCVTCGAEPKAALKVDARQAARDDLKKLEGTWDRVYMELEGEVLPPDTIEGWAAMYEGDHLMLRIHGKAYRESIVTLDPSRLPRAMNSWDLDGPAADETVPGIYEIDGDTCKVCFAKPGHKRPKEFTTKSGTGFLYCEYKRKKD